MKTFKYDAKGNLTVKTIVVQIVGEGDDAQEVTQESSQEISPAQLAVHLPMLVAAMPSADLLKAQTIIKGLAE